MRRDERRQDERRRDQTRGEETRREETRRGVRSREVSFVTGLNTLEFKIGRMRARTLEETVLNSTRKHGTRKVLFVT